MEIKNSLPIVSSDEKLNIFQMREVINKNPHAENIIPIMANAENLFFSRRVAQHKPVKLNPPIVKVVRRILS
tara:strand:+ start:108 stop:323 length:216 start_codon:yes stop_codon:yes gene_type:complete